MRCFQPIEPLRTGAGRRLCRKRILRIVDWETEKSNLINSPWILPYPQRGFSWARQRMSFLFSLEREGLPPIPLIENVHFRRTKSRCQRKIVSGWKIRMRSRKWLVDLREKCFSLTTRTAKVIFSMRVGLIGCLSLRCKIANWWRSTKISRSFSESDNRERLKIDKSDENRCHRINQIM